MNTMGFRCKFRFPCRSCLFTIPFMSFMSHFNESSDARK